LVTNESINESSSDNSSKELPSELINFTPPAPPDPEISGLFETGIYGDELPQGPIRVGPAEEKKAKICLRNGNRYYNELKDWANASKSYEEGTKLSPSDANLYADLWYGKGNALLKLGEINNAYQAYDKATNRKPNYKNAWDAKCQILKYRKQDYSYACSRANAPG
jgi:tetratricopeptide (TPR) repeat protein